jgi:spermidine/putrescine transport system ATP-binding protein
VPGRPKDLAAEVRLVEVTKRFGAVVAVDQLSLAVPAGSFFALLGPSGCGKTTTLRMVAGLEEPTAGHIHLDDDDITDRKPYKRPVNTVFQNYALFPHLDIYENVAFGLRRRGVTDVRRHVEELLALVELEGYGPRRPTQLSGGQQQRVALARALINRPRVLLLDEPLGALDLKLRRQMQLELKRIQTDVGTTFMHVTHDQEEAMTMADAIAVMNHGRIEQLGTPAELYERPVTAFVANFLGQSNLLRGRVAGRDGDRLIVDVGGRKLALPATTGRGAGEVVHVGVRPEKIHLLAAAGERESGMNELDGVIRDVSFTGVSTQYVVETPAGELLTVFAQNLGIDGALVLNADVRLRWDPQHTFAVDAAGGGAPAEDGAAAGIPDPPPPTPETPTPGSVADTVARTAER